MTISKSAFVRHHLIPWNISMIAMVYGCAGQTVNQKGEADPSSESWRVGAGQLPDSMSVYHIGAAHDSINDIVHVFELDSNVSATFNIPNIYKFLCYRRWIC